MAPSDDGSNGNSTGGNGSGNGSNGRNGDGRFGSGNKIAVGRRSGSASTQAMRARLRAVLVSYCTEDKLLEWAMDVEAMAQDTSAEFSDRLGAYKLLWGHILGAPTQDITIRDDLDEAVQRAREEIAARIHPAAAKS